MGDDDCSWAYDGCRNKAWHVQDSDYPTSTSSTGGEEQARHWKAGDVIGCVIEFVTTTTTTVVATTTGTTATSGRKKGAKGKKSATTTTTAVEETAQTKEINEVIITYYKNGINLGIAFRFPTASTASDVRYFFPALSVDDDQRVRVNIGLMPFVHAYDIGGNGGGEAVSKALLTTPISVPVITTSSGASGSLSTDTAPVSVEKPQLTAKPTADTNSTNDNTTATPITYPPLDLESSDYNTLETLQALPAERLKQELISRGLKCGGTVIERAARLWAVRGLSEGDIPAKLKAATSNTTTSK